MAIKSFILKFNHSIVELDQIWTCFITYVVFIIYKLQKLMAWLLTWRWHRMFTSRWRNSRFSKTLKTHSSILHMVGLTWLATWFENFEFFNSVKLRKRECKNEKISGLKNSREFSRESRQCPIAGNSREFPGGLARIPPIDYQRCLHYTRFHYPRYQRFSVTDVYKYDTVFHCHWNLLPCSF